MNNFLALVILGIFFALPVFAQENIDNFDVNISINSDSSITVIERIEYDFGATQKHGIYRDIPYKYKARGGNYELRFSDIKVTDEFGQAYKFTVSNKGDYKSIKIGDANLFVSGKKNYVINYVIRRALNYFDDHDELYWNVTGNEWPVTISRVSASVTVPEKFLEGDLKTDCFAGLWGDSDSCDEIVIGNSNSVRFEQGKLLSGEGLTIVVGFSKGIVTKPSVVERIWDTIKDNGILLLPILVFVVLFRLWWTRGRDPAGHSTIIAQYDPPKNLTPSEVGTIIDERADNKDITSDIINLAVLGYLKITRMEEKKFIGKSINYQLDKLKNEKDLKNDFERKLMESIFVQSESVKLSSLKNKFYQDLAEIKKQIYKSTVSKGYFVKDPSKTRKIYLGIGIGLFFIGILVSAILGVLGVISFVLSGLIIVGFSFFMPAKTKIGAETRDYILGLKEYLSVAEKDRIKFHNAPEKTPERFEKLLPFAMVLGVEKAWAKQFERIYNNPPSWYNDSRGGHLTAFLLADSLGGFNAQANNTLASTPRSASVGGSGFSGGFSGGGFGGGGGGSW